MAGDVGGGRGSSSSWTSWPSLPGSPGTGSRSRRGSGERESWSELIIPRRLREAIARINPALPACRRSRTRSMIVLDRDLAGRAGREPADARVPDPGHPRLSPTPTSTARSRTRRSGCIDQRDPENNDFMAAHQVTVVEGEHRRRFDVVLYVNGMPLGLHRAEEGDRRRRRPQGGARASSRRTWTSCRWRSAATRSCVVSDGPARCAAPPSPRSSTSPRGTWTMTASRSSSPPTEDVNQPIMLLLHGMFQHARFLDLLTGYVAFARTDGRAAQAPGQAAPVLRGRPRRSARPSRRCAATAGPAWSGTPRAPASRWKWSCTPTRSSPTRRWATPRSSSSPTGPTWTTSSTTPSRPASCSRRSPFRSRTRDELRTELANRRIGGIIFTTLQKFGQTKEERENGWPAPAAVGPPQRHRDRRRGAPLPLRRPRTATPGTCATRCRTPRSSRSPAPRSRSPTGTPATSSASTSS